MKCKERHAGRRATFPVWPGPSASEFGATARSVTSIAPGALPELVAMPVKQAFCG